ncbi:Putative aryl-alcohol dehydrogenase C977.14c [Rhizoctonia solani AG-1 IB]|uniref:Putative aryl-alcohol dehydrogenase C977.14c n=1 Tax=Thanatephorus cucumeris (strain AG1-IB / isolate 7/3/14) TaxID=1108050 RepID=M5CA96_THACB|nr:Putative aryl-alcohol dehydrogenase C977.14c [Rhizoctonia solani AG-1 IB]
MSSTNSKKMTYVRLGSSGLKVSRLILGLASYGNKSMEEWILGEEEGIEHIKAAYDAGIQTFDTANVYSHGESERILGKAIKELRLPRDEIVVMTKVYHVVKRSSESGIVFPGPDADAAGYVNQYGLSRKHIFDSIKHSLERLQLDYVDVLQCHRFDYDTPITETMQALHDVVKAGYARYIGMSSCHAYQFHAMQNYAISNNLTPFISMQNLYNLIYREEEREMMPTLKMFGVASELKRACSSVAWTKKAKEDNKEIILRLEKIAKNRGISMAQTAIAWELSKNDVVAPIIGVTSLERLKDTIGALDVKLTTEEIQQLEEPYVAQAIQGYT